MTTTLLQGKPTREESGSKVFFELVHTGIVEHGLDQERSGVRCVVARGLDTMRLRCRLCVCMAIDCKSRKQLAQLVCLLLVLPPGPTKA